MGGGSTINGMVYTRGAPKDFDNWAEMGETWAYMGETWVIHGQTWVRKKQCIAVAKSVHCDGKK